MAAEARRQLGPMAVAPMPQPGEVLLLVSDGRAFAYTTLPRPQLEDAGAGDTLAELDAAVTQLEGGGFLP
jgi:hypothetical protein